jgi:hypothetical protein
MRRITRPFGSINNLTLVFLLMGILTVAGCGGDDDNPTNPGGGGNQSAGVSATVNGQAWNAVAVQAINNSGIVGIGASETGAFSSIGLGWQDTGASTYTFGMGTVANGTVIGSDGTTWQASAGMGSGSITVTALDATHAVGTFSFTAQRITGSAEPETITVTGGTFDVDF